MIASTLKKALNCLFYLFSLSCVAEGFQDLKITEIMYHPLVLGEVPSNNLEFLEMKNTGLDTLDLHDVRISSGINFLFGAKKLLYPGEFAVIVSDSNRFRMRYPEVKVDASQLANSGEAIVVSIVNDTIGHIEYSDDLPWPVLADGSGFSIVPVSEQSFADQDKAQDWRNSAQIHGSPGTNDPSPSLLFPKLWINEVLSHTDLPEVDAVELYNEGSDTIDISHWYLSDSTSNQFKYQFPFNSKIPPGEYLVVDENDFNTGPSGFRFNRSGDDVYLFSSNEPGNLTGFATGWEFDAQFNGVSFGRHTNQEGENHLVSMTELTLGSENSAPRIGPLAIVHIMYHPDFLNEEYLVVQNTTDSLINLFHAGSPDSSWKVTGIDFKFPQNSSIQVDEKVVLTSIEPDYFRTKYDLDYSVQIFQYRGKMSNKGEKIGLWWYDRLDTSNTGLTFMPSVLMEAVEYHDDVPWPLEADGYGHCLSRKDPFHYGNDFSNWESNPKFPLSTSSLPQVQENSITYSFNESTLMVYNPNNWAGNLHIYSSSGKLFFF